MIIEIDTKYLGTFSKEALGWILHEYHINKRLGKKCKACGHIQGQQNKKMIKLGWHPPVTLFCEHHGKTHDQIMQRYKEITCSGLYDFLDTLSQGMIVTKDNIKGQIEPINIFFWQNAEEKLRREFGEKIKLTALRTKEKKNG